MDKKTHAIIEAHLAALEPECRWCFAVDLERVKGKLIACHTFPDAMLLHLACPRCGAEFTRYVEGWEEKYLENIVLKLHPEMGRKVGAKRLEAFSKRVFPEYHSF